ncbi:MAG: glycerophosphodiester phosphodiesterase family protein [Clostridiales bacterium]
MKGNDLWLKEKPIAHRGYHFRNKKIPENSLVAFENAINCNFAIELDVHISKDLEIFVYHDYNLKRITGIDKIIENTTYKELKSLNLYDTNYKIPILSEVLELVDGKVPLLIEIKNKRKIGILEEKLCLQLLDYNGDYAIQSFSFDVITWLKNNAPNIIRGQLVKNINKVRDNVFLYLNSNILRNDNKPRFMSCNINYIPNWIKQKRLKNEIYLLGWTVKNNIKINNIKKNFDNIIFEGFRPNIEK